MNTWAVIKTGGKQYKVAEGQTIIVEKLDGEPGKTINFDQVLAVGNGNLRVGTPLVNKAKVSGKIIETFKDKKVRVVKFKSKSKYMRTTGHRQQKTKVTIEKIQI